MGKLASDNVEQKPKEKPKTKKEKHMYPRKVNFFSSRQAPMPLNFEFKFILAKMHLVSIFYSLHL